MLTPFREILEERRAARAAVGAFTCYDVTTAIGVVRAVETEVSAEAAKPRAKRGAAATVATRTLRCITNDTSIETGAPNSGHVAAKLR